MKSRRVLPTLIIPLLIASMGSAPRRREALSGGVLAYAIAKDSTLLLEITGTLYNGEIEISRGSGFVVGDEGKFLTSNHVIPAFDIYRTVEYRAFIGTKDAEADEFRVLERSLKQDLALAQLKSERQVPKLKLADSDMVFEGERVFVVGFPLTWNLSIVDGLISNKTGPEGWWQSNALINPGNSGGPVFSSDGSVVAIAVGGVPKATINGYGDLDIDGINFFVPVNSAAGSVLGDISHEVSWDHGVFAEEITVTGEGRSARRSYGCASYGNGEHGPESPEAPELLRRSYPVSEFKEDNPNFVGPHSRNYVFSFEAEPGYRITEAHYLEMSANHCYGIAVHDPNGDGLKVELNFRLESGPQHDGWRGWCEGSIETVQELIDAG